MRILYGVQLSFCRRRGVFGDNLLFLHTWKTGRKWACGMPFEVKQQGASGETIVLFAQSMLPLLPENHICLGERIRPKSVQFCTKTVRFAMCT